ncbi:MAG: FGGY family carbohydrate kinase [Anaerolineales bacterium]
MNTWAVDFLHCSINAEFPAWQPVSLSRRPYRWHVEETLSSAARGNNFANTGIQFMQLNTLYQLIAAAAYHPEIFDIAKSFVTIPDLFNFWLTGELTNEFTNATTTQCFDPRTRMWSTKILNAFGIPAQLFKPTTATGTQIGTLLPSLAKRNRCRYYYPCNFASVSRAGSAVVAVPAKNEDFVWLSSGTWSIMGAEVREPCLTEKALEYNFTNEGGVNDTWRLSKNIMGLWLVQECRREWSRQE